MTLEQLEYMGLTEKDYNLMSEDEKEELEAEFYFRLSNEMHDEMRSKDKVFKDRITKSLNLTTFIIFVSIYEGIDAKGKITGEWDSVNEYIGQKIDEASEYIKKKSTLMFGKEIEPETYKRSYVNRIYEANKKYLDYVLDYYNRTFKSAERVEDKRSYLVERFKKYKDSVIPYYNKKGYIQSYHRINQYDTFVYNDKMVSDMLNYSLTYAYGEDSLMQLLPTNKATCEACKEYMGRIVSITPGYYEYYAKYEDLINAGVFHENCIHYLVPYKNSKQQDYKEKRGSYEYMEKVGALTDAREQLRSQKRIYSFLEEQDEVDKINQKIKKINEELKTLE